AVPSTSICCVCCALAFHRLVDTAPIAASVHESASSGHCTSPSITPPHSAQQNTTGTRMKNGLALLFVAMLAMSATSGATTTGSSLLEKPVEGKAAQPVAKASIAM